MTLLGLIDEMLLFYERSRGQILFLLYFKNQDFNDRYSDFKTDKMQFSDEDLDVLWYSWGDLEIMYIKLV